MQTRVHKPEPVYEQVYEILRNMIIAGELRPGTKLLEERLVVELGVSRTPIREALMRLQQDGLVRDRMVAEPSLEDIREIYQLRIPLEGYAAYHAAQSMDKPALEALNTSVEQAGHADLETVVRADTAFHDIIISACGNRRMSQTLDNMRALTLLCRKKVAETRVCVHAEHQAVFHAIMSGDADNAERLMREHVAANLEALTQKLKPQTVVPGTLNGTE